VIVEINNREIKVPFDEKFLTKIKNRVDQLIAEVDPKEHSLDENFKSFLLSAILFRFNEVGKRDLKILENTLHEMREVILMFSRHKDKAKISVFGSARTPEGHPLFNLASKFAELAVKSGFMIITGAGPGIMKAGNVGAGPRNSFGLGLKLPFENSNPVFAANPDNLTNFKYFFTRKLSFFNESDAIAALPGGYGTMDELFQGMTLIQTGKIKIVPIVLLEEEGGTFWRGWEDNIIQNFVKPGYISHYDMALHKIFHDPQEAVTYVKNFYKVFRSYNKKDEVVEIELNKKLSEEEIEKVHELLFRLKWHTSIKLIETIDHDAYQTYLYKTSFSSRDYSKLKALIDLVNTF
jgi:uncharacterized protein (TIGR00730 family)